MEALIKALDAIGSCLCRIDWLLPQDRCRARYDLDLNAALARAQSYRVLAICSSNFLENGKESWAICIDAWLQLASADANAYKVRHLYLEAECI